MTKFKDKTLIQKAKFFLAIFAGLFILCATFTGALAQSECDLGQVYVDGIGCKEPQISVTKTISSEQKVFSSSLTGEISTIRIDNPYTAVGQPVLAKITVSNIGSEYPFNLIPLPANQYGLVLTLDPAEQLTYKDSEGIYRLAELNDYMDKWDWIKYQLVKAWGDYKAVTSSNICQYVEHTGMIPQSTQQKFVWAKYKDEMKTAHSGINDKNFMASGVLWWSKDGKIDEADLKKYFPAMYEWECLRVTDRATFENEVQDSSYCGSGALDMGCISKYMKDNVGKLKTTSFVILSNDRSIVDEKECVYDDDSKLTYCGIGDDGICPPNSKSYCKGETSYTFEFIILTPADAPALSPSEFDKLINEDTIKQGTEASGSTGEVYQYGYTSSPSCPNDDYSSGCHILEVKVQAISETGMKEFFKTVVGSTALGAGAGAIFGATGAGVGSAIAGVFGIVKGIMTYGQTVLIGNAIYQGRGIFYVVAPALKVSVTMILWLALLAGASTPIMLGRKVK